MRVSPRIAGIAFTVLAVGGAGIGAAAASSNAPAKSAAAVASVRHAEPTGPDTDAIQSGGQTSADVSVVSAKVASASKAGTSETPGESSSESETGPSDGPGGHADATGDVQHEFSGVE